MNLRQATVELDMLATEFAETAPEDWQELRADTNCLDWLATAEERSKDMDSPTGRKIADIMERATRVAERHDVHPFAAGIVFQALTDAAYRRAVEKRRTMKLAGVPTEPVPVKLPPGMTSFEVHDRDTGTPLAQFRAGQTVEPCRECLNWCSGEVLLEPVNTSRVYIARRVCQQCAAGVALAVATHLGLGLTRWRFDGVKSTSASRNPSGGVTQTAGLVEPGAVQ